MNYPGGPNLTAGALRSRELSLACVRRGEIRDVAKGEIREILSVRGFNVCL